MPDITSVLVVGRYGITVGDSIDPDAEPDTIWCDEGKVRITPLGTFTQVPAGLPVPYLAGHAVIEVPLGTDGYLNWQGAKWIRMLDLTSSAVNPPIAANASTHRIEFIGVKADGTPVNFPPVNVRIAADRTAAINATQAAAYGLTTGDFVVSLPLAAPLPNSGGGSPIIQGPRGYGIAALDVVGDALVATLDDSTELTTPLPVAMVDSDAFVADRIETPATATRTALDVAVAARSVRNILDFGVVRGTTATQTAAIKTALDAHPGETFYFPPGDYRLDTGLVISAGNSLITDPANGARLYAAAAMDTLIVYDNGSTAVSGYAADKGIVGGFTLDGALLADKVLTIASVLRFTLDGATIVNGVHRGLVASTLGAEVVARNLRLHNTGTTNVSDNVAIEANMSDCQFSDISTRDWTTGIWDKGANVWHNVHPWLGTTTQLTARYASSIGFLLAGNSVLTNCYSDTYRDFYKTAAASGYAIARLIGCRAYANPGNLTDALAAANPGNIFNLSDGGGVDVIGGRFEGHPTTAHVFATGTTTRLNVDRTSKAPTGVTGFSEYRKGVQLGKTTFTPNVFGSTTSGTQTYGSRSGFMEVRDGMVTYSFTVVVTTGSTIAGNLRIGGLPMVPGAVSVNFGHGSVHTAAGVTTMTGLTGANGTVGPLAIVPVTAGGAEVAAPASTALTIRGRIECPFDYPS